MSLRTRILLLVLFAGLAPAAAFGLYFHGERERRIVEAREHLGSLAKHAAEALDDTVKGTVQLLHGLSRVRDIETADKVACSGFLASVLARYPQYTGLLTITPGGDLHCDSLRTGRTLNLSQRGYFRRVSESLQPAFDVVIGGLTGLPVLQVAYPVLDRGGGLAYVLLASMNLSDYARRVASASPYPELEMSLWDRNGILLLRRPEGSLRTSRVGKDDSGSPLFRLAASGERGQVVTLPGTGGESIAWVRALVHEPRGGGARLALGLSPQLLRAQADREFNTSLALMLGATLGALALAWYFANSSIGRHLHVMARVARRIGVGDLAARAGPPYPRGEMGELMAVLDRTAGEVESHQAQALSRNREVRRINRVLHVMSDINALIVRVRDRDELFREACRIAVDRGGFVTAWIGLVDAATGRLVPVASAGATEDFMALVKQRFSLLEEVPYGNTLSAKAIRERRAAIANDVVRDPAILFGAEHVERGSRSAASLPLMAGDDAVGNLTLHSREVGAFDEEEMKLLVALAGDIGFAIDHIGKQERLDHLAYYDALTGLANRTLFLERVAQALRAAARGDRAVALFLVDLERFRNINDSLGRPAGDALLRQVAQWLTRFAGDASLVARIDADRFAVMLPEARDDDGGLPRRVEKALEALLEHPFRLEGAVFRIGAKAGVALSPGDGIDAETLLRSAEAALKRAKATRERYLFHAQHLTEAVAGKLTLENQLRQAVDNCEFVLHYQPKVSLASGEITGLEALLRWNDPRTGLVPPGAFIPVLEETGLIHEVGRWALRQALADCLRWRSMLPALRIAVNISPLQLHHRGFLAVVEDLIARAPEAAAALELEITESQIMEDVKHSIASLRAIRALGMKVAIDDFGTGFSSLSYLARLPADTLKIDRSFVVDMTTGPEGLALVSTIINLAHSLKLGVVAEGVETDEQSRLLALLGCDEMQGYLFSGPVAAEAFEANFLASRGAGTGVARPRARAEMGVRLEEA